MFQSKHPLDSKYNSEAYKYRSKLFRPKTRSVIRKNEAALAAAFFSNMDVVNVAASNDQNPAQVFGSKLYKELLQHRLTKSIPWFLTLIGAGQDAMTVGVVCSYQHWKYREQVDEERQFFLGEDGVAIMGIDGGPVYRTNRKVTVLEDRPWIELLAVENLRIDRGSHWTDPVNTSPYLIHMIPMYLGDVKEMARPNPKTGEPGWEIPADEALVAATRNTNDSTRQVREGHREDSKDNSAPVTDYSIVWVHKNIVRKAGEDFCYYTLGTEHMLSREVKPLSDFYFHGERPYVMGCSIIETHKIYPAGFPELGKEVQKEINQVTNSRADNVQLVMNKRYIVKRGAQVDLKSLVRNVAASITLANDPEKDVNALEFNDVTSSAYQEQDRLNIEMDTLLGNFGQDSVMTNRKLNETVGGMQMMGAGANQMTEYTIRTLTETWVEPVLRQLVKLEKYYETDDTIMKLMGEKLGEEVTDEAFDTDVELSVNVGIGATDPVMRVNRLLLASRSLAEIAVQAQQAPGLQVAELAKEVFGAIGYRDGGRFYSDEEDPRVQQVMMQAQEVIQGLQEELAQAQEKQQAEMMKLEIQRDQAIAQGILDQEAAEAEFERERAKLEYDMLIERQRLNAEIAAENKRIANEFVLGLRKIQEQAAVARIAAKNKPKPAKADA